MAHRLERHLAARAAGPDRRFYSGVSPFALALRRAGDSRFARGPAYDHDADLGAVSVPAAPGPGGGVFGAALARDDGAHRAAEENSRAEGLQYRRWQRRAEAFDPAGLGSDSRAAFRIRHSLAVGIPALLDTAQSRAFASLGAAADLE